MDLTWFEQSQGDVPEDRAWLNEWERTHVSRLHISKRKSDWLLGRWTAKRALAKHLGLGDNPANLARIEIWPMASGAPRAFVDGSPAALTISLSHCGGAAACAITPAELAVGCDLERVEPRAVSFLTDYFTKAEQEAIWQAPERERAELVTLIWSAKESVLKALRTGLRMDTRRVAITVEHPLETADHIPGTIAISREDRSWRAFSARYADFTFTSGRWCSDEKLVRTLVWLPSECNR